VTGETARAWRRVGAVAAICIAAVAALLIATAARATSNTTIGFDDLNPGTQVSNRYQSQGVVLGAAAALGSPVTPPSGDCGSPSVVTGPPPAYSPPNYARLATCGDPASGQHAGTFGKFVDYPRGSVTVRVINLVAGAAPVAMTITGYDSAGNVVASGSANAGSSWTALTASQLSGSPVPAQISYFLIDAAPLPGGGAPSVAIDDLSFDQAGAPLSATGVNVSATAGSPFSGAVATLSDGDPTAVASDFTATITWGDGASSAGTVTGGPGQFTISASHTWAAAGSYALTVSVKKVNGRTASASSTATVAAAGGSGGGGGSPSAVGALLTPNPTGGRLVALSGAGSSPGSGRIISYDWGFDNPNTTTSTGANPVAHWIFKPGLHTVTLTVTNSGGQQSTTHFGVLVGPTVSIPPNTGGQGPCQPSYDNGSVHIVAECIQTLPGGGYVAATHQLELNGMVLVPQGGGYGVFKILPFKELGIGSGTQLTGPAVTVELLNTPIGDMALGGLDLTATPITLTFQAFHPPTVLHFGPDAGGPAHAADDSGRTLLMSLGVGKSCSSGAKDPTCCPPSGGTTACATLPGGFPLTGQINVYLNNKGQSLFDVQVGLDLSAVNFEATGALEIEADPTNGINLNSLQFTIPEAGLANIFQVKNASFVYYFPSDPDASKRDTWQAKATIVFGPLSQPSLAGELDFQKGQFKKASMLFTAPTGTGVPIYPGILVNQIGATVGVNPLEFGGQLGASIATQLELSLAFLYSEPTDTRLGFFGGQGTLSFQGDKIASLAADVYSDGYTDAALDIDLHFPFDSDSPVVSVTGHIGFWDEPSSGRWEADGKVGLKLWVISAEVAGLVNNTYIAGCADVSGFGVQGRYSLVDGSVDGGLFGFSNCDDQLKQYKQTPVTPHTGGFVSSARDAADRSRLTAADTRGGGTITLPGGTDGQELLIRTSGAGTPQVTIYAPGNRQFTSPLAPGQVVTSGDRFISAIAPDGKSVLVFLRHPAGGTYNIQPTASSPPISAVAAAQDVPPARISTRVRHLKGRRWRLDYVIRNYVPGTQVQFVERGRDSTHVLGAAHGARGSLSFVPQDAIARRRTIFAYLRSGAGVPLRTLAVGRYTAPAAQRPGPPRRLRLSRAGARAILTWAAAPGARQYLIVVKGSDGRLLSAFEPASRRRFVLGQVLPTERFTATVTAEGGPNMLRGPARRVSLAAASTGRVELLSCSRGRCTGRVVPGTLVLGGREIRATLARGAIRASGIAGTVRDPRQLSLMVRRRLPAGRYRLTLSYRRAGRTVVVHGSLVLR